MVLLWYRNSQARIQDFLTGGLTAGGPSLFPPLPPFPSPSLLPPFPLPFPSPSLPKSNLVHFSLKI